MAGDRKMAERAELRGRLKSAEAGYALVTSKWPSNYPDVIRYSARVAELRAMIARLTEEIAAERSQPRRTRRV